jgi:protein TonB
MHAARKFDASQLTAPSSIPKQVAMIRDLEDAPSSASGVIGGVPGGVPGGVSGGVVGGVIGGILAVAPPPPPPPQKEAPKPPERVRIGGKVQAALLIHEVDPQYPALARQARINGAVLLSAIIGRDGTVQHLVLVSGNPMLVQAAMDAVKQWVYKPTYLNGVPVEVLTDVVVNFRLSS